METHVKVLGVLHLVLGALGVLGALVLVLIFGSAAGIVGATGEPGAHVAIPIIGITGMTLVLFLLVRSVPGMLIGIGLLKYRSWARIGGIVLSILDLIWMPVGTIVGIYGLWVLFSKDTERLFGGPAPS
ncbi:MAG TPA: hypothetical protein VHU82_04870 [Vicinamibacterales bacterium]|jgi:hypothetical protein|nr:hypothetical protein [Vicinamibacterales bacterium]